LIQRFIGGQSLYTKPWHKRKASSRSHKSYKYKTTLFLTAWLGKGI